MPERRNSSGQTEAQLKASVERARQRAKAQGNRAADQRTFEQADAKLRKFRKGK